jgi:hypothetical protein
LEERGHCCTLKVILRIIPKSSAFFYHGILDGKNPDPRSGINVSDHISESLVTIFIVKNTSILCILRIRIRDRKIQIRDGKIQIRRPG